MKKISKPQINSSATDIFQTCIDAYCIQSKKDELSAHKNNVELASTEYDKHIPNEFDKYNPPSASPDVAKTLIGVYEYMFVTKGIGGFYDEIIANANRICPYCGEGTPQNLDHFLPKTEYPFLVVTPENLVPSCRDCNMEKRQQTPTCNEDVPLHPYYDDIHAVWLEVVIDYSKTDCIHTDFINNLNKSEDPVLAQRIDMHMQVHGLKNNFSAHATSEINSRKRNHLRTLQQGIDVLERDLKYELESCEEEDINSWRSALYRELIRNIDKYSDWLLHLPTR